MITFESRVKAAVQDISPRADVDDIITSVRRRSVVKRTALGTLAVVVATAGIVTWFEGDSRTRVVVATEPAPVSASYGRTAFGYVIDVKVSPDSPLLQRVRARLDLAQQEALAAGTPAVPARCFPDRTLDVHVTRTGVEQFAPEDSAGYAIPPDRSGLEVAESLGRRGPDGKLLNLVVLRVSTPGAVNASLVVEGRTVDTASVTHGWVALLQVTSRLSFLSDVGINARVTLTDNRGQELRRTPVPAPEVAGAYC